MNSIIHSSMTGRQAVARGALKIDPKSLGAHDLYDQLATIGIHGMDKIESAGFGMDSALVGPAGGNLGAPAQFLQFWLPGQVTQVTAVRNIDKLVGMSTVGAWEDEEVVQTLSQLVGKAELYGDSQNVPLANYDTTYERRTIIRFENGMMVDKLEEARASKQQVNMAAQKRNASARALDIQRNKVGFYGFNTTDTRCYGFLNDPNLPAYVNVAAGAGGLPWSVKTFLEITKDIRTAVTALVTRSGGNVDPMTDEMTLAIPLGHEQYMSVTSDYGISVQEWISKSYPKMRVASAPELQLANGGANVFYLYADKPGLDDDSTDDGMTFMQAVPTRFMALGTEVRAKGYVEDYTNASAGVLCKRPWAVVRYSGI